MNRVDYYTQKTDELLSMLPDRARKLLAQAERPATTPLAQAVLVLSVCTLYSRAWLSKEISGYVKAKFYSQHPATDEQIISELLHPIRNIYLLCELPFSNHWNAASHFLDFLTFYFSIKLTAGTSMHDLLEETQWLADKSSLDLTDALALSKILEPPTIEHLSTAERDLFRKYNPTFTEGKSSYLDSLLAEIHDRPDLVSVARFMPLLSVLSGQPNLLNSETQLLVDLEARVRDWSSAIPYREALLFLPADDEIHLMAECVRTTPSLPRGCKGEPQGTPDSHGSEYIPLWLSDRVFGEGDQFNVDAVGPIAYIYVVKPILQEVLIGVGIEHFWLEGEYLIVEIVLRTQRTEDNIVVPLSFNITVPHFLRVLMLAADHRAFRLDVLAVTATGLTLVENHHLQLPDHFLARIKELVKTALRERFGNSPKSFAEAYQNGMVRANAADLFAHCEYAKSEWLLRHGSLLPPAVFTGPTAELWRSYRERRHECLTLLDQLAVSAHEPNVTPPSEQKIAEADAAMEAAGTTLRLHDPEQHDDTLGPVAKRAARDSSPPPDTCFVHFGLFRRTLHAGWAVLDSSGSSIYGNIDFPNFDLDRAVSMTNEWLTAAPDDRPGALLPLLEYFSATVTSLLMLSLGHLGTRNLVLSPTWFLHLLPLHATGISPTNLLMDQFVVSYSPSLRLLQRSRSLPLATGLRVAAVASPDAPGAAPELRVIRALWTDVRILGDPLTPKRVLDEARLASHLHFACHGVNHADPRCSALMLDKGREPSIFSVPRILRDGDFSRVALVFLAACHSGRHVQRHENTVQDYLGMDVAFLMRGARTVISSLWELHGAASLLVTARFYAALREGFSEGESLRMAVDDLRSGQWRQWKAESATVHCLNTEFPAWRQELAKLDERGRDLTHPHYWAAFKLSGQTH